MDTLSIRQALALQLCRGLGVSTLLALQQKISLPSLFTLGLSDLLQLGLSEDIAKQLHGVDWQRVDQAIKVCEAQNLHIIHYFDKHYPVALTHICNPPWLLFCRGNIALLNRPQIAVVGSRAASRTGLEIAYDFAKQLSQSNLLVTSGMARGIDGAAHTGALDCNKETIAVLGTGVDVIYPQRHRDLYWRIAEQGLLISEFLPGTRAHASHFPRRNRIISGLSLGVLLVEAEIKSGSLITARYALEQNKEVFAIPGSIRHSLSQGCHFLLKQGAKLTEHVSDILEEVSFLPENSLYIIESEEPKESCPILHNLGYEVTDVDTLVQRTQWPVEQVLARLLDLELEDKVERVLNGYIKLARG
ncbi:DNA-processing protein DprA [Pseudoalteromonas luteoviolacea]|uniref:DNA-processing protein DprA n=1 Tax=Pseudoalteromonas luteoviolacea TaxID=43657 RepID=UPI001B385367|nr:DNA-processing protein DprA [Pseudoalteromonas luteoviolacea]MBQ4812623.1 DNA-processing protein DprA [Pseudoalteromonas luteoviolacea]